MSDLVEEHIDEVLTLLTEWKEYERTVEEKNTLNRYAVKLAREAGEANLRGDNDRRAACQSWAEELQAQAYGLDPTPPQTSSGQILHRSDVRELLESLVRTVKAQAINDE